MNEHENFESAEQPAASPWTAPEPAELSGVVAGDGDSVGNVGESDAPNPQQRPRRLGRTLAFAGAVTAVGAAIGMAIGVAADGHHESRREASASADALPPVRADVSAQAATNRQPAPVAGQWDGHDFDGGRGGFDGHRDAHRGGPGGDRQVAGTQRANGPVSGRPSQSPASASHGS